MWERNVLFNPIPEQWWPLLVIIESLFLVWTVASFTPYAFVKKFKPSVWWRWMFNPIPELK
ncbi:MAG: hypothetical protein ACXAE3_16880 [Candidatus Kariarchaeaceae archaeon]